MIGTSTTDVSIPNLAHDDDGKYHLVTTDPDGTLRQQSFADAGFDIDITGEGALIKEGENVEVSSLTGPDENGYHGGLVTISADNVELQAGNNVSLSSTTSGLTTTYTINSANSSVQAGTITAADGETQLAPTTSGGTTVTGAWNNASSTSRFGVAVATGDGISIDANGALQANESVVAAGDNVTVSASNDGRITTYTVLSLIHI